MRKDKCAIVKWIIIKGTQYKQDMILYEGVDMCPLCGVIDRIYVPGSVDNILL